MCALRDVLCARCVKVNDADLTHFGDNNVHITVFDPNIPLLELWPANRLNAEWCAGAAGGG